MPPTVKPPRFIPTLTEVIGAPAADSAAAQAKAKEAVKSKKPVARAPEQAVASDELVDRVMRRLQPSLERQIRASIATLVQEQASLLELLLTKEINTLVRQSVMQAVMQETKAGQR